jgi:hypothetical protein
MYGKTIRIYLKDRTSTGVKFGEVVNSTIQSISCPRNRISELTTLSEAVKPGIYFLFGVDKDTGIEKAYIGEAENVVDRLQTHLKEKEFWSEVVFFNSKDLYVTKAHVRHLESKIIQLARTNNRYKIENYNQSQASSLSLPDIDAMDEFFENLKLLLGVLGHKLLEPLAPLIVDSETSAPIIANHQEINVLGKNKLFKMAVAGLSASAYRTDEGMVVLTGSEAALESKASMPNGYQKIKNRLIEDGVLIKVNDRYQFTKSHLFDTASPAASVVVGTSINGRDCWKDESGISLNEIEANTH